MTYPHEDWNGCYNGSWSSAPLVPDAFAHPAKVPFALAERIYRHMLAQGWLAPGDRVIDPFGGIAGCGFHAALYGMHWTGVELEQKFVDLGNQNIDLWRDRYAPHFPRYGSARLLQGDSRRLAEVVAEADAVVSSPPYQEQQRGGGLAVPGAQYVGGGGFGKNHGYQQGTSTPGQLGAMPAGDYDAVVSSPPYSETRIDGNGDEGASGLRDADGNYLRGPEGWQARKALGARYGSAEANLGNMPAGDFDGVVSSPPYLPKDDRTVPWGHSHDGLQNEDERRGYSPITTFRGSYSDNPLNLGNPTGANQDTFWAAAAQIVAQCRQVIKPGGYAAWITGDFVRNKQRVPFGEQWLALCQAHGFEPVLWATAWKVENNGTQIDIFGNHHELTTSKVSFFRRLANRNNPDAAVENEDVIFMRASL